MKKVEEYTIVHFDKKERVYEKVYGSFQEYLDENSEEEFKSSEEYDIHKQHLISKLKEYFKNLDQIEI